MDEVAVITSVWGIGFPSVFCSFASLTSDIYIVISFHESSCLKSLHMFQSVSK
jgi:hypothetical protein